MTKKTVVRNDSAFTLVELMIVIAIIGILAAVAVPQFLAYRTRSYNAGAKSVTHNVKADESNLMAELGVYGSTETDAYTLTDGPQTEGVLDSRVITALRLAATGTVPGARIIGIHPKTGREHTVGISIGDSMAVRAQNNYGDPSANWVVSRHTRGDTAYGVDSDIGNRLYAVSNPAWADVVGLGAIPPTSCTIGRDDFVGTSGGGAPTDRWVPAGS